ncbi:MAG: HAMP domain-containing sensor histidine kinase [Clostridiaceae bacterium]
MKKEGLVSKLLIAVTGIVVLSFIIIAAILSFWFEGYFFEIRKKSLDNQAQLISTSSINYLGNEQNSAESLNNVISYVSKSLSIDILLVDNRGYVYAVSEDKYQSLKYTEIQVDDIDQLREGKSIEKKDAKNSFFNESGYEYYKPIISDGNYYGFIVMITPLEQIKEPLNKVYLVIWISAVLAIMVSVVVIYILAQNILIRPLSEINIVAKRIAKGEVGQRVSIRSNDEIGELADSFNIMADSLEKVDNNRREFISNVSHEIRSPITSIQGFIAGMLDGIIPKDKENYYLKIVYDEIQRLTRLVNKLLDMSAMEAGKVEMEISEIDINDLIRKVVANLENKIVEKKLNLHIVFQEKRYFVLGDRDRLIQVVTNLVDNAIKYAYEGGNIKISTKSKLNKIYISIYNDGPVIAKEDLNDIWQRFYKADRSRTNKLSTGLGLSIVREIITQHGNDVWVENSENDTGVTFIFTLTKAT